MDYGFLSYSTTYKAKFKKKDKNKEVEELESISKVGAACFSSLYSNLSVNRDKYNDEKVSLDLSIMVSKGTDLVSKNKDNYCHLSTEQINHYIGEINKIFDLDAKIVYREDEKDVFDVNVTINKPNQFKGKSIPCLIRYLYEKEYMLLLCCSYKMLEKNLIEGYGIFQYLIINHIRNTGTGHSAFICPSNHKDVPSNDQLKEVFNRERGANDYLGLSSEFLDSKNEIPKLNGLSIDKIEDIDSLTDKVCDSIYDELGIQGFFE